MKLNTVISSFVFFCASYAAASPNEVLTLDQAIELAKQRSPVLQQAKANAESAEADLGASKSQLYPKLTLDGSYKRQSVVPEVSVGLQKIQLTDDHSYSIGPTLSFVLWDSGLSSNRVKSLSFLTEARKHQLELSESQIRLSIQIAYIQAALAEENALASEKAERLANVQNKDIQARRRGGSATPLDALSSDSEVLNYQLKSEQSKNELTSSLADLFYFIGAKSPEEIGFESLSNLIDKTASKGAPASPSSHPLVRSQIELVNSAQAALNAQKSSYWPTLTLQARSSLDYPNGPNFEQINQNSIAANLSWALFDFGGIQDAVHAKAAQLKAAQAAQQETIDALKRDFEKTKSKIQSLQNQIKDADVLVAKQEKLAQANFSSFKFGSIRFSDVQTANLRLLEAETRLTLLRAQYLIQVFTFQYLSEGNSHE